tara:strand:- start:4802 stop:5488 length:687 start_codon:yes stop_codon:yes gene_type:complete
MSDIKENIKNIKNNIKKIEENLKLEKNSVKLLAVSKTQSIDNIKEAYNSGQQDFGENYLQESIEKISKLKDFPITWHFIGHVQSNKSKLIAENYNWVHSIDKISTLKKINKFRENLDIKINVCIQVNIDQENTKSGIQLDDVENFLNEASIFKNINIRGLMAIPKYDPVYENQYKTFMKIKKLFDSLVIKGYKLDTLSIGMSSDYEAAIAAGSSIVRIGTSIFGKREK